MKKFIALVLAVMMVLSCSIVAAAEGTATLKFKAEPFTEEGQVGTVELIAENVDTVTILQIFVEYDATKLEIVSVTPADTLSGMSINSTEAGKIYLAWEDTEAATVSGTVVTFEFKAISDELGEAYIGFIEDDTFLYGADFDEIVTVVDEESEKVEIDYVHEHDYSRWVTTKEANCTEDGEKILYCAKYNGTCDEYSEVKVVDALGHLDEGKDHTCDRGCGATVGEHSDSKTDKDHVCDYGCGAVLEECSDKAGDKDHKCDVCGKDGITDHVYGDASCDEAATCTECGESTGSALGHLDENKDHTCDRGCGKTDMGEHSDSKSDKDHVCDYGCGAVLEDCSDKSGDKDHKCDVCGKDSITDHDYDSVVTEPTCTEDGYTTHTCSECGHSYTDSKVEKLGHKDENKDHVCENGCGVAQGSHSDSKSDKDHVCDYGCGAVLEECSDKAGDKDHDCDVCGKKDITKHSYSNPDCEAPATCDECGVSTGSALGHKDENKDHTCDNGCGKTDMGEHSDSADDKDHVCDYGCGAVLEECSDKSGDKDHKCDVCDKDGVTDHDYDSVVTEPTCTEDGYTTHTCSECENSYESDKTEALGHSGEWVAVEGEEPTCTVDGKETRTCTVCGETETRNVIATGHKFGAWEIVKHATQYNEGLKQRTCSVCGETETAVIPKIDPDEENPGVTVITPGNKTEGETNPNTGAVSVIGIMALAAGAAFVSKKRK